MVSSNTFRLVIVCILSATVVALVGHPTDAQSRGTRDGDQRLAEALRTRRVDLDLDRIPFEDAVAVLSARSGLRIVASPRILRDIADEPVTLHVTNMRTDHAVDILCDYMELGHTLRHGVVWITSRDQAYTGETTVRLYDVRDLALPVQDFPMGRIRLRGNDEGPGIDIPWDQDEPDYEREIPAEDLVDALESFVGGDTWNENPEASIQQVAGLLIVRQTGDVHRQIAVFLNTLRRNR